jgi:hypothetical protein
LSLKFFDLSKLLDIDLIKRILGCNCSRLFVSKVDLAIICLASLPKGRKGCFETLLGKIEELLIIGEIEADK